MASSLTSMAPEASFLVVDERPASTHVTEGRRRQQRIAEITEMIHVASLLHDDVIDTASTRRGLRALNITFGNKVGCRVEPSSGVSVTVAIFAEIKEELGRIFSAYKGVKM